ncbi:MAG: ASKHA domain-containing protein [Armatimonadota bacterium]|nr:ASKHA domain-containing protein [Armatimonadota bacterium]
MTVRSGHIKGKLVQVRFEPDDIEIHVKVGTTLSDAAISAGCAVETPCGGMGTCGKCRVFVTDGVSAPDESEKRLLGDLIAEGVRLACRARVTADTVVNIPEASRSLVQKILCSGMVRQVTPESNIHKYYVEAPEPTLLDERAEFERIADSINLRPGELQIDVNLARKLSSTLRDSNYKVTAVIAGSHLLAIEPGDTTAQKFGVAFDLGSTTIVGYLLDLNTGHDMAVASSANPQMAYGDDLISRINFASTQSNGLEMLTHAASDAMNRIVKQLCASAGINANHIYETTVVGNSCMTHLLLGIDPTSLGQSPYVPTICKEMTVRAPEVGLKINSSGLVHVLPNVAGFVGSDLVAVLLASMWEDDGRTRLAVDIGTNGEMALRHAGRTLACSAAAGPAFEGARIGCGMRGGPGAIDSVRIGEEVVISTIDNKKARGLCGSGLVDAVAEMLNAGIVDEMGRLLEPDEIPSLSPSVHERLVMEDDGPRFVLAEAKRSATGKPIVLTQRDIRQLQLAKGSIRAAIQTLLKVAGAEESDLSELLLAGAFGNYIRKESAVRIGLCPDIPIEKITSVGNAAGTGAKLALLSVKERGLARKLAESTEHIELANHPDYQNEFMEMMLFPQQIVTG